MLVSETFNNWVGAIVGLLTGLGIIGGFMAWLSNLSHKIKSVETTVSTNGTELMALKDRVADNYANILEKLQANELRDAQQGAAVEALTKTMAEFTTELSEIRKLKTDFVAMSESVKSFASALHDIHKTLEKQRQAVNAFYAANKEIKRPKEGW